MNSDLPDPGRRHAFVCSALGIAVALMLVPAAAWAQRVVLEPGLQLAVRLDNTLSTKSHYHYFGNIINATLDQDVLDSRGHVAIPAGSMVRLAMPEFKRAGLVFGRARIRLRLFSVALPDGSDVPLDGYATELDNGKRPGREGTFHGRHSLIKDAAVDTTSLAIGAGAGFAVGGPLGLPVGAAAGLLSGGLWTVGRRGPDLVLPAGTVIEFTLGRPASVVEPYRDPPPADPPDSPDPPETSGVAGPAVRWGQPSAQSASYADSQGGSWGQGTVVPPSADVVALLNQLNDPRAVEADLDKIDVRNRSDSDRVFVTYLRGVCDLELSHPKRAEHELVEAYAGAKRLNLPGSAQREIAKNLVLALRESSPNWQANPLMRDPELQAVLVQQERGY